jgi:hypothetical protein
MLLYNKIDSLKRLWIFPIGAFILLVIIQQIIEQAADPVISQLFNISTTEAESLKQIDYSWLAPIITVLIVGFIASWYVQRAKNELKVWQSDCKMLVDWKKELELEKQHLQEELQRVYALTPSSNPQHEIAQNMDMLLRASSPRDAQLVDIERRLGLL